MLNIVDDMLPNGKEILNISSPKVLYAKKYHQFRRFDFYPELRVNPWQIPGHATDCCPIMSAQEKHRMKSLETFCAHCCCTLITRSPDYRVWTIYNVDTN